MSQVNILQYDPRHRILICRECQYAVQPSALDSHLLRHKVYRQTRYDLIAKYSKFDLCDPHDIALPTGKSPPIPGISIIFGFRCGLVGCGHLCASSKRLRKHWTEVHPEERVGKDGLGEEVSLQTVFRGVHLRYFEVDTSVSPSDDNVIAMMDTEEPVNLGGAKPAGPASSDTDVQIAREPSVDSISAPIDMDHLRYFHHFTTHIAPTLASSTVSAPPSEQDLGKQLVDAALTSSHLMRVALSVSAAELCLIAHDRGDAISTHLAYFMNADTEVYTFLSTSSSPTAVSLLLYERYVSLSWQLAAWRIKTYLDSLSVSDSPSTLFKTIRELNLPRIIDRATEIPLHLLRDVIPHQAIQSLEEFPSVIASTYGRPSTTRDTLIVLRSIDLLKRYLLLVHPWAAILWSRHVSVDFARLVEEKSGPAFMVLDKWHEMTGADQVV